MAITTTTAAAAAAVVVVAVVAVHRAVAVLEFAGKDRVDERAMEILVEAVKVVYLLIRPQVQGLGLLGFGLGLGLRAGVTVCE